MVFLNRIFRSNDSGHEFEKLMWIDILFHLFSFLILSFDISLFLTELCDFLCFILYQVVLISWPELRVWQVDLSWFDPYYSGYRFVMLIYINISTSVLVFFISNFCSWNLFKISISLLNPNLWYVIFLNLVLIILVVFFLKLIFLFNFTLQ